VNVGGGGVSAGAVLLLVAAIALLILGNGESDPEGRAGGGAVPREGIQRTTVERVVDGDTIEVGIDGRTEDVRYIGVDTPETVKPGAPVECYGPQATEFNHELVEGETVRLRFDRELRDVYGRLLAYVYVGETFVNAELVSGGYARTLEIEPNTSQAGLLSRLQSQAAAAGRGLWGSC
jgi:micrococcal nuclease